MQSSDFDVVRTLMADPGPDVESLLASVDTERDATVVVLGGRVVAWAIMRDGSERFAGVDPSAAGQGIGTWLLKWSAWRAKSAGVDTVVQRTADANSAAWLLEHGHEDIGDGTFAMRIG